MASPSFIAASVSVLGILGFDLAQRPRSPSRASFEVGNRQLRLRSRPWSGRPCRHAHSRDLRGAEWTRLSAWLLARRLQITTLALSDFGVVFGVYAPSGRSHRIGQAARGLDGDPRAPCRCLCPWRHTATMPLASMSKVTSICGMTTRCGRDIFQVKLAQHLVVRAPSHAHPGRRGSSRRSGCLPRLRRSATSWSGSWCCGRSGG